MLPIGGWLIEDKDSWFGSFVTNSVLVWFICWMNDIVIWTWIKTHQWATVECIAGYIGIGIIWAIIKFSNKARKVKAKELIEEYGTNKDLKIKDTFNKFFSKVPVWIAFWPWVLVWDFLSDFLKSFFEWLSDILKGMFVWIFTRLTKEATAEAIKISKATKEQIEEENPFND